MMPLRYARSCHGPVKGHVFGQLAVLPAIRAVWPRGQRRWFHAPVRKGVGSNPTAVIAEQNSTVAAHGWGTTRKPGAEPRRQAWEA